MESLELIDKGFRLVANRCIKGIKVNAEKARQNAEMRYLFSNDGFCSLRLSDRHKRLLTKPGTKENRAKKLLWRKGLIPPKVAEELFDVRKLADRKATIEMFNKFKSLRKID